MRRTHSFRRFTLGLALLGALGGAVHSTTLPSLEKLLALNALLTPPMSPPRLLPAQVFKPGSAWIIAQPGDGPELIAQRYGARPSVLRVLRGGAEEPVTGPLKVGQLLKVPLPLPAGRRPVSIQAVRVQPGDTLSHLMLRYDLSERELISANLLLGSLDKLAVGTPINIPTRETGLLIRIKPGQSAAELIQAYRAEPLKVAAANGFILPTELKVGDELLLPGIYADSLREELLARRLRAIQQARAARVLAQYQAFEDWKAARLRERQQKYDEYQAYLKSPQRLALVNKYQRQAEYETWLAHQVQDDDVRSRDIKAQMLDLAGGDPRPQMQAAVEAERRAPPILLSWPLASPRLTSRFGEQDIEFHQERFHGGLDMAQPLGTPVHAAHAGLVTQSGDGAFGLNVYVQSGDLTIIYGHLSSAAVQVGEQLKPGDLIGAVGCSGECTGPHLHFELRLGGVPVDPLAFLP